MVAKRSDYTAEAVEAARSVLLELSHLLGEYQESMVIVGGWVPQLLLSQAPRRHIGSIDVDIALDHRSLREIGYKTIGQLLLARGYRQSGQPFIFFRTVQMGEQTIEVEVDFLAGEYSGTTRGHRTQKVQDMRPRKARGCGLAVSLATEATLSGTLPDGGKDTTTVRVASIVPFLVMKAMALAGRLMEKDAWDIYYLMLRTCMVQNGIELGQGGSHEQRNPRPVHRLLDQFIWTNDSHGPIETDEWGCQS